jgi:predicted PolB exonuclease-like 3'-5' exonuclease
MKLIRHRGIILGVNPPPVIMRQNEDKWGDKIYDTMLRWDAKNFIGLDKLCRALGIEGKGDFSGKDVYKAWAEGEETKIRAYCADDVRKTRAVYKRMTFKKG